MLKPPSTSLPPKQLPPPPTVSAKDVENVSKETKLCRSEADKLVSTISPINSDDLRIRIR